MSLGNKDRLTEAPSSEVWESLFVDANEQAVIGVCLTGIERLPQEQRPPQDLLLEWVGAVQVIEAITDFHCKSASKLISLFEFDGFRTCILKGIGTASLYPNSLRRQCGDIDLWVDGNPSQIVDYVQRKFPLAEYDYLHIEYPWDNGVSVEIHYRCSYLFSRRSNRRLQAWFDARRDEQFSNVSGNICFPTHEFNRVYQLTHILRHFLGTGIGMRHMIDYYYLLKQGTTEAEKANFRCVVRELGLYDFAAAVMYVEQTALGLEDSFLLMPKDEKRGEIMMRHIMHDGDFGNLDDNKFFFSALRSYYARLVRLFKVAYVCPKEAFSKILYRKPRYHE